MNKHPHMLRINKEYLLILPLCDNSEPFLVVLCVKLLRLHLKTITCGLLLSFPPFVNITKSTQYKESEQTICLFPVEKCKSTKQENNKFGFQILNCKPIYVLN